MKLFCNLIFPRLIEHFMSGDVFTKLRAETLTEVAGDVLEIGFGTGLNLPHYSAKVNRLSVVDKNPGMNKLAERRIAKLRGSAGGVNSNGPAFEVRTHVLDSENLPMANDQFDSVVSTWTLCSIKDALQALGEAHRVLKPGGRFYFLEHGLSHEPAVQRWQHRLTPIQRLIGDGCHLNRDIGALVGDSPFVLETLETFYMEKTPRIGGYLYRGVAVKTP